MMIFSCLHVDSSPLNYKRIMLLKLLEPSNDRCVIIWSRVDQTVKNNDESLSEKVTCVKDGYTDFLIRKIAPH